MNAFSTLPYTLSKSSSMPDDAFARIVSITDNAVNRSGLSNLGKRSLDASVDCTLYTSDELGRFDFNHGTDRINKNLITMYWAEHRGFRAIEVRNGPLSLSLPVVCDYGFNAATGVDDAVSYTLTVQARIHVPARFISALGLSLEQPVISRAKVERLLAEGAIHLLSNSIDEYGNVDPRLLYSLFNRLGLYILGRPVILNYRSARMKKLKEIWEAFEKKRAEFEKEQFHTAMDQERHLIGALPKLITDLTASGMTPEEIRSAIASLTTHMQGSSARIHALVNDELGRMEAQYHQTIARLGNPEVCKPTAQNRLAAGADQPYGLSAPAQYAPGLAAGVEPYGAFSAYPAAQQPPALVAAGGDSSDAFSPNSAAQQAPRSVRPEHPRAQSGAEVKSWQKHLQPSRSYGPPNAYSNAPQHSHGKAVRLICRDCGTAFEFTDGERAYFEEHKLDTPRRCPACRNARKAAQAATVSAQPLRFGVSGD